MDIRLTCPPGTTPYFREARSICLCDAPGLPSSLTRDAASFAGETGIRPGGWDILILQDDLNERRLRWIGQAWPGNALRTGQSLHVNLEIQPEGTGHSPTVEFSCNPSSRELTCSVEPGSVFVEEQAEVRVQIRRSQSSSVSTAALLVAPLCALLWSGTKKRKQRLLLAGSVLFCSIALQSCTGLLRESATVQVTARTSDQSVSTDLEVILAK